MTFFDYFQISSVVIFLFVIISRVIYLRLVRNINPIAIGGGKKGLVLVIELLAFAGLLVWMVEIVLYATHSGIRIFPWPLDVQLFDSPVSRLIGVLLISWGLVVFILAYVSFGDSWRIGFDTRTPGALVTSGIFAFTRNPIYLFLDLWFVGIFLINGTLFFLIFAILTLTVIHWQILQEEAFCADLYGQPYCDYRKQTPRYI